MRKIVGQPMQIAQGRSIDPSTAMRVSECRSANDALLFSKRAYEKLKRICYIILRGETRNCLIKYVVSLLILYIYIYIGRPILDDYCQFFFIFEKNVRQKLYDVEGDKMMN